MKKIKLFIFATIVFTAALFTQSFAIEIENESSATVSLIGSIVDLSTGEALAGVKIEIEETNDSFYTDLDGNFTINGLKPGNYNLTTSMISYEMKKVDLDLANNKIQEKLEIKLDLLK
jgi:hypothetical protein